MLILKIARTSPTHHILSYTREDGSGEEVEIETKSFLIHDFTHFCVESESHLTKGFFGLLNEGYSYAELSGRSGEVLDLKIAADVEQAVSVLHGVLRGRATTQDAMDGLHRMYTAYEKPFPTWVNPEFLNRVVERYKKLIGEWNSLAFGESLTLEFGDQST
jgi:hypothetical protein